MDVYDNWYELNLMPSYVAVKITNLYSTWNALAKGVPQGFVYWTL